MLILGTITPLYIIGGIVDIRGDTIIYSTFVFMIYNNESYNIGDIIKYKSGIYVIQDITEIRSSGSYLISLGHIYGGIGSIAAISEKELDKAQKQYI